MVTLSIKRNDVLTPLQSPIGRVHYVYSGPDKIVTVVKVRTTDGMYK